MEKVAYYPRLYAVIMQNSKLCIASIIKKKKSKCTIIDENETLLKAMFEKRLKTYHLMGYQIFGKEPIVQRKVEQLKLF